MFLQTLATDNSVCNDSNFERESYTVLHLERKSGRGGELSIFVREEIYFKHRTDLSINSNDVESLCIEIHQEKDKNILFSVMCRPPNRDMTVFEMLCEILLSANDKTSKKHYFCW